MSEIISYKATSYEETVGQMIELDGSGAETNDKQWDRDDLTPLVAANANVLVMWQGAEVTLSDAIRSYLESSSVTEESQDIVIAMALELLANPVIKNEESAEEEEKQEESEPAERERADQKSHTKAEVQKVQKSPKVVDPQKQPKNEIDDTKPLEPSANRAEKIYKSENEASLATEVEVTTKLAQGEPKQPIQARAKAEDTSPSAPEILVVKDSASVSLAPEVAINEPSQEFKAVTAPVDNRSNATEFATKSEIGATQQTPTLEIPEAGAIPNRAFEPEPEPEISRLVAGQETEPPTLFIANEADAEPEVVETSPLDLSSTDILDGVTDNGDENMEAVEGESTLATLDHQMDINGLANFAEEEILLDHLEEASLEPDELYTSSIITSLVVVESNLETLEEVSTLELSSGPNLPVQMEITGQEQLVQIATTIEEVEDSLIQLTERIKTSEPETIEAAYEILDKIIEVPAKLEESNDENIIMEAEVQEELEELFTELLDRMDIDYTPELIESLAYLTLKWNLVDEIESLKIEEEADEALQDRGTHEIIKKLLLGLSFIKKAITHAHAIGRSVIQLYMFNFAA